MSALEEQAVAIAKVLQARGYQAVLVGGCVRDALLGVAAHDFDVATDAPVEVIEAAFPRNIPVGRQFGVVVVLDARNHQCQVARFRSEGTYTDSRRPDTVEFGSLADDVWRRDLTINALALDPVTGEILDYTGGQQDLAARLIRTCGNPQDRFAEDPLRLLRAVRFAAKLDFQVEPETWQRIQDSAALIGKVSPERIRDELTKIWTQPNAGRGLQLLRDSGLLRQVLPEIAVLEACAQSPDHHPEGNVFNHVKLMLASLSEPSAALAWAVVLHDVAKPGTAQWNHEKNRWSCYGHAEKGAELAAGILRRLKADNALIETVTTLTANHMVLKDSAQWNKATLRRHLLRPTFGEELALQRADALGSDRNLAIVEHLEQAVALMAAEKPPIKPLLDGRELMALGIPAGPEIGRIHRELLDAQLEGEVATKAAAGAWLRRRQELAYG